MKEKIDKQAIEEMARVLCDDCRTQDTDPCKVKMCDAVLQNAEALYNAGYRKQSENTVEVVPRGEGEWIDKATGAFSRMQSWCSACGKHSGIGGLESIRHKPYCPNCGASMKGGE